VAGTLLAGEVGSSPLEEEECWRVMTGAPLPPGADAVVMREEVAESGEESIEVRRRVAEGSWIARRGSELRRGDLLARVGTRLDPPGLGLALASGRLRLRAHRRPRVAVLSSGGELTPPGETPGPGRIRASNPWMLAAAIERQGAEVQLLGIVPDHEQEQRARLEQALACDLVVMSGGTGRGRADLTRRVLELGGVEFLCQGLAMDPGRPALCGRRGNTLVFALPGTPLAAWILWRVLVLPCLRRLAGEHRWQSALSPARLASPLEHASGVEVWVPADLSWAGVERIARPRSFRGAGSLRQHIAVPALVRIPPSEATQTPAGAEVQVLAGSD
jgi:molybdopterin molybdotransferase